VNFFSNPTITQDGKGINLRIAQTGEVFLNDAQIGKIVLVVPEDKVELQRISNGEFIITGISDIKYLDFDQVKVRQGWLENSNVDVVSEMVQMIELQRMFEAGSKVIQTNDSTLDRSIALGRYF